MAWTERVRRGARATGAALRRVGAATLTAWRVGTGLMLLAGVGVGLWIALVAAQPRVQDASVLVMALQGPLVDDSATDWREQLVGQLQGRPTRTVSLRDFTDALERAAGDARIRQVLIRLDDFEGGGLASLREAAAALERFKARK